MWQNKFWFTVGGFLTMFAMAPRLKCVLSGMRTSKSREDMGGGMSRFSLWRTTCLVCAFCAVEAITSPAQTFKTLLMFNGADGGSPLYESLVQGRDGNFYGTTYSGGANAFKCRAHCGTVFKITPAGKLTTLYSFCPQTHCPDGSNPVAGLVQATNGNFYGTTGSGGAHCPRYGCGTVFEITPAGKLTTLHSFNHAEGAVPRALVQATDGNFYGTTLTGGVNGQGTVFKITPAGKLTRLYSFCSQTNCIDGSGPEAALVQATDGNFYGTTVGGGTQGYGTVYEVTPTGKLTTLYSFCPQTGCPDGAFPSAGLVQATDGNFYGTTEMGGAGSSSCPGNAGCGTVFKITPAGQLTTLYSFCSHTKCTDGSYPWAGLVQASNGNLYGTTANGGANDFCVNQCGTVFETTAGGSLTTLYSFCSQTGCTDGNIPFGTLMQATNGNFYGTTSEGGTGCGSYGCGTVFSLSVGLGRFVKTLPTSGKPGTAVIVLGNSLKGATRVTFNGTKAAFRVVSSTELRTTVPSGATTGFVQVTTPLKTLTSDVVFRVTK
jgi:uncharacterized repeat protein (TIGR03803 family)